MKIEIDLDDLLIPDLKMLLNLLDRINQEELAYIVESYIDKWEKDYEKLL